MTDERTRLIVLTDISSDRTGFKEPDDTQSLVRLLLYANDLDIEGLIATYTSHWHDCKPEYIAGVVSAYGRVRDRLAAHDARYPTEEALRRVIKRGNPQDGLAHVGQGCDTEGSDWIIERADAADERPLWIAAWGGTTDLAQALWKVRRTRSPEELSRFVAKLRVYAIADQYGIGSWIRDAFPDLFFIVSHRGFRGMYKGGDRSLTTREWVEEHVRSRGPLGEAYPQYDGGDLWHRVVGLKEGDTPSFLYLLPNGLNRPEEPTFGGWGGRFARMGNGRSRQYVDAADTPGPNAEEEPGEWTAVSRWRSAYQASFAARMAWCVLPPERANREPVAVLAGEPVRRVAPGAAVELDIGGSYDPGGRKLSYRWRLYREAGTYRGEVRLEGADQPRVRVVVPDREAPAGTLHVIAEAINDGTPPLTGYARVMLEIG